MAVKPVAMSAKGFQAWHAEMGWAQDVGAGALGVSRTAYSVYLGGRMSAHRTVAPATRALLEGLGNDYLEARGAASGGPEDDALR